MTVSRVLIANRGEIAVRIIRACEALGIETVLAFSEADRDSLPVRIAGRAVCIGPANTTDSYLNIKAIVSAALGTGSDAIHPGYGFLAESPELAQACAAQGITFVGPRPEQIQEMGNKLQARALARQYGLPILPGSEKVHSYAEAAKLAERIGLPVMMKAAAGGGGRGMKIVMDYGEMQQMFGSASAEARAAFGDDSLYLERYIPNARHIEVQVLGDRFGNVIHLGERDCSLQRRHQKLVEESPAPAITEELREEIRQAGVTLARNIRYENAGTVEFIVDQDAEKFYFLEMNTRIQVEHPVSEMITGIDLVQEQFRVARGERLRFSQSDVIFRGHAIECRINAELPAEGFRPSPGRIVEWNPPQGPNIRLDTHCYAGYTIPMYYDSMLGKLIVYGTDRTEALARMRRALEQFSVSGIGTTLTFLHFVMGHPEFEAGRVNTNLVEQLVRQMLAQAE
ncbi:MAG: acetyl-CoA carboxylase biotin carboxylase subunit [Betaproteobacteria bacterium RIFCSPLOWO2_02_FULL_65_20]|nr:MAG: acetyl-CoA carboxylase biotin carboxylase subunit [Betaproteobacteria bacterium RIFCSPLOWO2_02_FULL_65_20]